MYRCLLAALAVVLLAACSAESTTGRPAPSPVTSANTGNSTPATGTPSSSPLHIEFETAFNGRSFDRPTELGAYPGGRFFLADQGGLVSLLHNDGTDAGPLLDYRSKVLRSGNEEGFLSLTLDPQFPSRPYIYAYYSAPNPRRTMLSRFEVKGDVADPASELVILEVAQPFSNHKGGAVRFGPDGMLYLSLGDGGSEGDPQGNGQSLGTLLGKIIRIDVRNASREQSYAIPADNPFAGRQGARPEIWAYGLRNPWRMTFDSATGRLWAADVGGSRVEEVDVIERGGNYGWNRLEGNDCLEPPAGCDRTGTLAPVATYTHEEGCSISGGIVYRGSMFPALAGHYLYADFCSGKVWAVPVDGGEAAMVAGADSERRVSSFATDEAGNVYLLVHGGPVLRIASVQ
jgi:glucose/arabinose dehydrogenase